MPRVSPAKAGGVVSEEWCARWLTWCTVPTCTRTTSLTMQLVTSRACLATGGGV